MTRKSPEIRIEEQHALIEKARKRNAQIELAQVKRFQRIAKKEGAYDTEDPESLIEQAIKEAVKKAKTEKNVNDKEQKIGAADTKNQREIRVYQQNLARIERASRSIRRLKIEARRIDASQKWRLGFLLQLANLETLEIDALDKTLETIVKALPNLDSDARESWKKAGFDCQKKHEETVKKNVSSSKNSSYFVAEKADSHRKITLGGLVKKHQLDSVSPALLLGALLDSNH